MKEEKDLKIENIEIRKRDHKKHVSEWGNK